MKITVQEGSNVICGFSLILCWRAKLEQNLLRIFTAIISVLFTHQTWHESSLLQKQGVWTLTQVFLLLLADKRAIKISWRKKR